MRRIQLVLVFLINAPIGIGFGWYAWQLLKRYQDKPVHMPIDKVGLGLLVVWVASLQMMLDEGKNHDWFASNEIIALAVVAAIGFAAFLIWEMYEKHPIVDLKVFRHRGFTASVLTIALAFGAYFGASVLTPLWLQTNMGYTATEAGKATAWTGATALFLAPWVAQAATKRDPRMLVFIGVIWMGALTLYRTFATTDMGFWHVAIPLMIMGSGLPLFFVPTTGIALGSVEEREMDSAAGLMNFLRTLSGAIATSVVTTVWSDQATRNHAELVGLADSDHAVQNMLAQAGMTPDAGRQVMDYVVTSQSLMLSTNQVMTAIAVIFLLAAAIIWMAPRPTRQVEAGAGGH